MLNSKTKQNAWSPIIITKKSVNKTAHDILLKIRQFRRMDGIPDINCELSCNNCFSPHLSKIINSIKENKPILFVLPAFPGKSPNPLKVIGSLPDMAERSSLFFLNKLCKSIQKIYSPGAHIIICSDGRIFSDTVGLKDSNITAYQKELDSVIFRQKFINISTFNLDQLYIGKSYADMRKELLETFGKPISLLQERVRRGNKEDASREDREANRMYKGITKFLFEDSLYPGQTKSRNKLQKEAKKRAYDVMQCSNAWSELIARKFPQHVRLSIHSQTCGDVKIGINLLAEPSITPWHGVALNINGKITIVKKFEAEKLKAKLIYDENGRPDHYKL